MSGHSKWHNIAQKKGVADAKRGQVFSKLAKAITVCAKTGGADPTTNFSLRLAIEKARAANMPKDNIDRALARGSGLGAEGMLETVVYEGMAPGGAAVIVEAFTDNKNRTLTNVRTIFTKYDGNMEVKVMWMFARKGLARVVAESVDNRDVLELALIEAGAEDISWADELVVVCDIKNLQSVEKAISAAGLKIESAEPEYVAREKITLKDEQGSKLADFLALLEADDDVQAIYTNAQ